MGIQRDLARLGRRGVSWRLPAREAHFVRNLDALAARGKSAFGNGAFLVSCAARASLVAAEQEAAAAAQAGRSDTAAIDLRLSAVERAIVARLDAVDAAATKSV